MEALAKSQQTAAEVAEVVKAIAHPMRLRIIALLCGGDLRVMGLARRLGQKQSAVSQQLRILRMSGLIAAVKREGQTRYTLARPRVRDLVNCLEGCQRQ